jgi:hypothetical protein
LPLPFRLFRLYISASHRGKAFRDKAFQEKRFSKKRFNCNVCEVLDSESSTGANHGAMLLLLKRLSLKLFTLKRLSPKRLTLHQR